MKRNRLLVQSALLSLTTLAAHGATATYSSGALNLPIPDDDSTGLARVINVPDSQPLTSVSVSFQLSIPAGSTGWLGDIYAYLQHGSDIAVLLNRPGRDAGNLFGYDDSQNVSVVFDDTGPNGDIHEYRSLLLGSPTTPLTGPLGGTWEPDGRTADPSLVVTGDSRLAMLGGFAGSNTQGAWTLFVADLSGGDIHQLDQWSLEFTLVPEPSVNAAVLGLMFGGWWAVRKWRNRRTDS